jgi:hypothetical protein
LQTELDGHTILLSRQDGHAGVNRERTGVWVSPADAAKGYTVNRTHPRRDWAVVALTVRSLRTVGRS